METLTARQLDRMQTADRGIAVINVLGADAFEEAHIPGSINIPVDDDQFLERVGARASRDEPVIVYCASKECQASPRAARTLESAGYEHVYDFEGGMKGWQSAGLPVEQAD